MTAEQAPTQAKVMDIKPDTAHKSTGPTQSSSSESLGINAFASDPMRSGDTKTQGRAVVIIIAIVALIFINAGIFYTTQITKQTNNATLSTDAATQASTSQLDQKTLDRLGARESVNVDQQLNPFTTGRSDPFTTP